MAVVSTPARLVAYLEGLPLVGGDLDGELMRLFPWERRFVRGAFGQLGDSALSVARANGKSALCSGIACAVLDGPLHGARREVVCVASSFQQARVIYEDVLAMMRARTGGLPPKIWRLQDSQNAATLEHRASGARVRCLGGDPRVAHGLRPALVLADEPAQWEPARSEKMLAALRTGLGKVPGSSADCARNAASRRALVRADAEGGAVSAGSRRAPGRAAVLDAVDPRR